MNRREAIQKLAAGGAVAAGASVVLSTNDVAFAASPPDTGLVNVPGPGQPLPITSQTTRKRDRVTINAQSPATCASGGTPTVTYAWKVNSFTFSGSNRRLLLRNARNNQTIHLTSSSTGYSAASSTLSSVVLYKVSGDRRPTVQTISSTDTYSLSLIVTWQCAGANSVLEAEYVLSGTGTAAPTVTNTAYNVF